MRNPALRSFISSIKICVYFLLRYVRCLTQLCKGKQVNNLKYRHYYANLNQHDVLSIAHSQALITSQLDNGLCSKHHADFNLYPSVYILLY